MRDEVQECAIYAASRGTELGDSVDRFQADLWGGMWLALWGEGRGQAQDVRILCCARPFSWVPVSVLWLYGFMLWWV